MKKVTKILIILLLLIILIPLIKSEERIPEGINQKKEQVENIKDSIENITKELDQFNNKESREEYLKRGWENLIKNSKLVKKIQETGSIFNPLLNPILGLNFEISWTFLLSLLLLIFLTILSFNLSHLIKIFIQKEKYYRYGFIMLSLTIIIVYKMPKLISLSMLKLVANLENINLIYGFLGIISTLIVISTAMSYKIKNYIKKIIEKEKQDETIEEVKELKEEIQNTKLKEEIKKESSDIKKKAKSEAKKIFE